MSTVIEDQHIIDGVRRLMKTRKVTLRRLASETGIPYRTLQNYLNGESRFPAAVFLNVINYLGIEQCPAITDDFKPAHFDLYDAIISVLGAILGSVDVDGNKVALRQDANEEPHHRLSVAHSIAGALAKEYDRFRRNSVEKDQVSGPPKTYQQ